MAERRGGLGWPVLVSLLAFLAIAAYLVWQSDATQPPVTGGATIGPVEPTIERSDADTWRHHAWSPDGGSPGGGAAEPPAAVSPGYDPQRRAMERAFGPADDGGALPFGPIARRARIVAREGAVEAEVGALCEVRVLPMRQGRFDCVVRVMCGREVLYPNPSQTAGFVTCELDEGVPVRVDDRGHSALDGDPRLTLDLRAGTVEVRDLGDGVEPYRASLRIEAPRER